MKYCENCGAEAKNTAAYCPECGKAFAKVFNEDTTIEDITKPKNMRFVAFIFMIISCCAVGWGLIPLIWMIPMTIKVYKSYKYGYPLTQGFKILTLIFVNIVAGIVLLVENDQE